ncbi:MAG TPA: ABC transporter ATP-binding protein [Nitrospira sp.]|nr:ABC transporter ATP-binding protein [Nitrospira sp.]
MGDIAIRVQGISKQYRIGKKERYKTLRDTLASTVTVPFQRAGRLLRGEGLETAERDEMIWALKDISVELRRGEAIGVIGANGSGKSTFLKILSRITEPTTGFADIYGRVGSLLEVGTGFHPELTGRENTYLNGAILGMRRDEIDRKFDEIVAFSEVERFIDTPVKHYSSGMYLRLAFAVAAHLEPEILLVDEVLAVGDAGFQKKCLGKMGSVTKEGRTVLLVSHNMGAIAQLCERTVHLEQGRLKCVGPSAEVVSAYLSSSVGADVKSIWFNDSSKPNHAEVRFISARLLSVDEQPLSVVRFDSAFFVEIAYAVSVPIRDLSISYKVHDTQGNLVFEAMDTDMPEWKGRVRGPGQYRSICEVLPSFLKPGRYHISLCSFIEHVKIIEKQESILSFDVSEVGYPLNPGRLGIVSPVLQWKVIE